MFETTAPTLGWVGVSRLFGICQKPSEFAGRDAPVELGIRFASSVDGEIDSVTFHRTPGSRFPAPAFAYEVRLWNAETGAQLARGFARNPTEGKLTGIVDVPVPIRAGVQYIASYCASKGGYAFSPDYFDDDKRIGNFTVGSEVGTWQGAGVYGYGPAGTFPTESFRNGHYWVDVVFEPTGR